MTPQEFAALLNGRQYMKEITPAEAKQAKDLGLVVMFGYSDDNVELAGAINEEVPAYEGTTLLMTKEGLLPEWSNFYEQHDQEEDFARYFRMKALGHKVIEALWDEKGSGAAWTFRTDIQHATFDVMDGDERFCRGIVFALSDV